MVSDTTIFRSGFYRIVAAVFMLGFMIPATAQTFQTAAPQAVLMDAETGAILFETGGETPVAPASLVKILTAEVVFSEIAQGRLKLDDEMVVSENAWRRGGAPSGGSSMFAVVNSKIKVSDLLNGLIVASGNDAAITLAEGLAGSESNFAGMMNRRAQELGLTKSRFRNSNGWPDPDQRVTMRDMVKLADHIIRTYPEYYRIFGQREMLWSKIKQQNRNPLLAMDIGVDGLKTGNIDDSGYSIVASAVQNGQRLIIAMSGMKTSKDRQNEAKKLLDWGFRNFEIKTLFSANASLGTASVYGGAQSAVSLITRRDVRLPVPRGAIDKITAKVVYRGPLLAPLEPGVEMAKLRIYRGPMLAMEVPLYTAEAVNEGSLSQRATDAALEAGRSLFKSVFQKITTKPDNAK